VEGIGEDFVPSTLDLSLVDEVIRVGDKEAFLMTRRLVREEGIFAGGSSGAALAATLKYAQNLPEDRLVVVIFPDTGARYLSKIFNDAWMREHGFLETDWRQITLREVLRSKELPALIAARPDMTVREVIGLMEEYDISQMPVLDGADQPLGMVHETGLLRCMALEGCRPDQPVREVMDPVGPTLAAENTLEEALPYLLRESALLVTDAGRVIGVLTKMDLLDILNRFGRA